MKSLQSIKGWLSRHLAQTFKRPVVEMALGKD